MATKEFKYIEMLWRMAMHARLSVKEKPMGFLEGITSVIRYAYNI